MYLTRNNVLNFRGLIGASVSQFKSKVLRLDIALFKRLRNSEDR